MTVKQISIFLENKMGRMNEVTRILGDNGVNINAFSVAENSDFGILRLVVTNVDLAIKVLKEAHFAVNTTEVVCLNCPNTPGALAKILEYLAEENIFIEYMYAFSQGDMASVVIRPSDTKRCIETLQKKDTTLINSSMLYNI